MRTQSMQPHISGNNEEGVAVFARELGPAAVFFCSFRVTSLTDSHDASSGWTRSKFR